ncbi:MAG: hypothetical protein AAGA17_19860 [Actinomycetota bacterium]
MAELIERRDSLVYLAAADAAALRSAEDRGPALVAGPGRAASLTDALGRTIMRRIALGAAVGFVTGWVLMGALAALSGGDLPAIAAVGTKSAIFGGLPAGSLFGALATVARWSEIFFGAEPPRPDGGWLVVLRARDVDDAEPAAAT